ncbi:intraflagellar transport-associated protein-like [Haliotis asinina]|uniref:intraflagellar transport-associated protein-like n=1 Tax=Haliotis asinina TaxID=109174 RepID=UPI003532074E
MNEPSPERQNAINRNIDEGVRQVIDSFVNKSQETTESLIKSFTYLTMDDVLEAESKKKKGTVSPVVQSKERPVCLSSAQLITEATPLPRHDPQTDDDGVEEQTLDEGTKTGTMTDGAIHHGNRPLRKFDNFVDDAGSDGDDDGDDDTDTDDVSAGGYSASFAETGKSVTEGEVTQDKEEFLLKEQQLPHATQQATECDLSMLVDQQYDADFVDEDDDDVAAHLNPGEVEVPPDIVPTELELLQVTSLDITTTRKTGNEDRPHVTQSEDQVCSDQVEAFCLDEDFDYDNVKLTPKFTPQEWQHLQSFIPADSKPS